MKKFSFNFKFFERFKKSKDEENNHEENFQDEEIYDEAYEEAEDYIDEEYEGEQEVEHQLFRDQSIDENELEDEAEDDHLDASAFTQFPRPPRSENHPSQEDFSDHNPEEFAEKTLGSFDLNKFREEHKHLENDYDEEVDKTNPDLVFKEMATPSAKEKTRFDFKNIKFPKFSFNTEKLTKTSIKNPFSSLSTKDTFDSLSNLSWTNFILRIFSPYSRQKIQEIFMVCLVLTFTYIGGKTLALFFAPVQISSVTVAPPKLPSKKPNTAIADINKIVQTNLFNAKSSENTEEVKPATKNISSIICLDAERPSSEPLKLLDTIVLQDSVKSVASVQVRGQQDLVNVREGESINNNVEVSKISRLKLILKNLNTGECEYIAAEEAAAPNLATTMKVLSPTQGRKAFQSLNPSIKNEGNNFKIKRNYRDQMISNMSEILTQARAIQMTNPDGSLAFKMTEVVPGSIYSQLNIQNDDVITSINGKKIENLNELMGLLGKIREIDQFQIGLRRNGVNETLEYGFE